MGDLYPSLAVGPFDPARLVRGLKVQTRIFYADSLPGTKAIVIRFWAAPNGYWVRCRYGKTLLGKSILKTMPANVLALDE